MRVRRDFLPVQKAFEESIPPASLADRGEVEVVFIFDTSSSMDNEAIRAPSRRSPRKVLPGR